ncbi:hypothetical protein C4577_04500 [Candidatus Parcubacteria bacterium]|nr:MAG: hypothetical protein C4577_04500 [Candidatus Parcubacteria bacterium]
MLTFTKANMLKTGLEAGYESVVEEWYASQEVCRTARSDCAGFLKAYEEGRFNGDLRTLPFEEARAYSVLVSGYRPSLENTRVLKTSIVDGEEEREVHIVYVGKGKTSPIAVIVPGMNREIDGNEVIEQFIAVGRDMSSVYHRHEEEIGFDCRWARAVSKMSEANWLRHIVQLVKDQNLRE